MGGSSGVLVLRSKAMSRVLIGLAVAVGLVASTALAQVASKPGSASGSASGVFPSAFGDGPRAPSPGAVASYQEAKEARLREMVDNTFRQYDKNKDGVIDKDEMAAMPRGLQRADSNGDGKITREEMTAYFNEIGMRGRAGGTTGSSSSAFQGGPPGYPPATGSRPESFRPRQPSEPPDPRAPMVAIQAVLVELVQDEPGAAVKQKPGSPAAEPKPAPAPRGKSEFAVIDLDLAAPPETILAELRKLGVQGRLDVLNRVQLTTLDKQSASVQLTRHEPMIMGVTHTTFGTVNTTAQVSVGLLVGIEPRVAPGDVVVLQIDVNESRLGRTEEGVVLSTSKAGETIRQAPSVSITLRTTVKTPAGKTVVVAAASESGPRRTETMLLVSARVLNVKSD
jgi:hypothetical protein